MSQSLTCPRCRRRLPSAELRCPHCDADLAPLVQLRDLANTHFNDGLRAARGGHWHQAAEQLAVTLALVPDDVEAVVLLAKISRRQGRRERARQLWETASELAPHREDIRASLAVSRRPVALWERVADLAPSRQQIADAVPSRDEIADLLRRAAWSVSRHHGVGGRGSPAGRSGDG